MGWDPQRLPPTQFENTSLLSPAPPDAAHRTPETQLSVIYRFSAIAIRIPASHLTNFHKPTLQRLWGHK